MIENTRDIVLVQVDSMCVTWDRPILHNLTCKITDVHRLGTTQGQVVAVLAPSGKGKTQFFNVLSGIQNPTSGTVLLTENGKQVPVQAGMVGVVSQNHILFENRTVMKNLLIAAGLGHLDRKTGKARAIELLTRFGLADQANKYPVQLSGGQHQRVAIIQQMLCSRHYLLMDEPFSGLDPGNKDKVCDFIREVSLLDELNTIIFTTHDIASAITCADTLWLIGCDYTAEGVMTPGAYIKYEYDLAEWDLAWQPDVTKQPRFYELVNEIRAKFDTL